MTLKKNWFVVSEMTRISWILTWALKILKSFTLTTFCAKYIRFDLKKYRGVIFHNTEEWCKIWSKTDLRFKKWHEEYDKLPPEDFKVSKLWLWWESFIQSGKCMTLKFTKKLCAMAKKNDTNIEEEFICRFKIGMRNLTNFAQSTQMSQKHAL